MKEFLIENAGTIIAFILLAISIIVGTGGTFQNFISKAMLFAEKQANKAFEANGKITGEQKKAFVCDYVYRKIPKWLKAFVTQSYIAKKIENIIVDINDIKDDGVLNGSAGGDLE